LLVRRLAPAGERRVVEKGKHLNKRRSDSTRGRSAGRQGGDPEQPLTKDRIAAMHGIGRWGRK
jgi:hypothetical protein